MAVAGVCRTGGILEVHINGGAENEDCVKQEDV